MLLTCKLHILIGVEQIVILQDNVSELEIRMAAVTERLGTQLKNF